TARCIEEPELCADASSERPRTAAPQKDEASRLRGIRNGRVLATALAYAMHRAGWAVTELTPCCCLGAHLRYARDGEPAVSPWTCRRDRGCHDSHRRRTDRARYGPRLAELDDRQRQACGTSGAVSQLTTSSQM